MERSMVIPELGIAISMGAILRFINEIKKKRAADRMELAKHLKKIAALLQAICQSLKNGKMPRKQSYELAQTINFAIDRLKGPFPIAHMDDLFDERLPRIGYLMRQADIFIDGRPRPVGHGYEYSYVPREEDFWIVGSGFADEMAKEIERAVGDIDGAIAGLSESVTPKKQAAEKPGPAKGGRTPKKKTRSKK
jgi:hypothetical protein